MKRSKEEAGLPDRDEAAGVLSGHVSQSLMQAKPNIVSPHTVNEQVLAAGVDATGQSSDCSADHLQSPQAQSQTESKRISQPQQEQIQPVLELDNQTLPRKRMRLLAGHLPYPQHHQTWQEQQHNPNVCSIRLIGDATQPHEYVGVSQEKLITHSAWAQGRLRQSNMQTSGLETLVPTRTPPSVVRKLIEALYTGFIELEQDVEALLILANCLQVPLQA